MPYRTIPVKAPLFMTHRGVKVYHVFKNDDADSGVIRQNAYTFDPINGSDNSTDGRITFDVTMLSTWQEPQHPPFLVGTADKLKNGKAWDQYWANKTVEKAVKAAIRAALDKGEIRPPMDGSGNGQSVKNRSKV